MKRLSLFIVILAVLGLVAPALAQQAFYGNLHNTALSAVQTKPWQTFYEHGAAVAGGITGNCTTTIDGIWCEGNFKGPKVGGPVFRSYIDDIGNYDGTSGNTYSVVWTHEENAGTPDHVGYFSWSCSPVNINETATWNTIDCVGPDDAATCLGQGNADNATATDQTPQGTISPIGGLAVMPVPTVQGVNGSIVDLAWKAVTGNGCGDAAEYDLYYYIDDLTDSACNMPTADQFTFLRPEAGTTTSVDVNADLGPDNFDPTVTDNGIVFALKLRYNSAGDAVVSKFMSANGQCVSFSELAADIYDLQVRVVGRAATEITWKTSLEDGVRGFYVTRSFTENGPYTRVSDLIPANGEPSAYSYIDKLAPRGRIAGNGLFYKVETLDIDDAVEAFGPVSVELPGMDPNVVPRKLRQPRR